MCQEVCFCCEKDICHCDKQTIDLMAMIKKHIESSFKYKECRIMVDSIDQIHLHIDKKIGDEVFNIGQKLKLENLEKEFIKIGYKKEYFNEYRAFLCLELTTINY